MDGLSYFSLELTQNTGEGGEITPPSRGLFKADVHNSGGDSVDGNINKKMMLWRMLLHPPVPVVEENGQKGEGMFNSLLPAPLCKW